MRLLLAIAAAAALPTGCDSTAPHFRADLLVFASPASVEIHGVPAQRAERAFAELGAMFGRMHRDWHPWEAGALTELNAAIAAGRPAQAPQSLHELIDRSRHYAQLTDHLFDPAIGGLVRIWGFHTSTYPVASPAPGPAALAAWRSAAPTVTDLQTAADGSLRSRNPAVQLDFGAIAEGVAAEQAAALLASHGIDDALLSLGGDVFALGRADHHDGSGGGRPWRVAIRDPAGGSFASVDLSGREALFSSGAYHKFRETPEGARWPHLLDPRTGQPVTGVAAVSVLHPDPVLADVAATALFVAGPARFAELSARLGLGCALLLTDTDTLLITQPLHLRLTLLRQPAGLRVIAPSTDSCSAGTTPP